MKTLTYLSLSLVTAGLLLSGCGSSSSDDLSTTTSVVATSGQLVDNYVANVDYTCSDGTQGVTDENGTFNCSSLPVEFHLGGLKLGQINTLPRDKQVFPQDLVGVPRIDVNNTAVRKMAQFLQSCDDDNNTRNGILIKAHIKTAFADKHETFDPNDVDVYATDANITLISEDDALTHLEETTTFVEHVNEHGNNKDDVTQQGGGIPQKILDALLTPAVALTQETKNTLAYMGNEERLAYDVYTVLYNYQKDQGVELKQLTNIANNSETTHIATVQLLVEKYIKDISEFTNVDNNTTNFDMSYLDFNASTLPTGVYNIDAIASLYNTLITKGQSSAQDALEVGCMVEVTDINDLDRDIAIAQESNATDIVTAFEFLRDGSYSHYWAFDKGLKNMGVTDGCCVLGDPYCHPEYPQNENSHSDTGGQQGGNGQGNGDGTGAGHQYGKNR